MKNPAESAAIDQAIAESGEQVDRWIVLYRQRAAEKGHEQALCDLVGLCVVTPELVVDAPAHLMVAVGRLARSDAR